MVNETGNKIALYKVYRLVEGQHEKRYGFHGSLSGMFVAADLHRDSVEELVDELRTRYAVAGRRVVGVHAYERPQDEDSWGEIEVHYQGDDCVLSAGIPEMVEPDRIILNLIRYLRREADCAPYAGQLDNLRKGAAHLEENWFRNRRGELQAVSAAQSSKEIPF